MFNIWLKELLEYIPDFKIVDETKYELTLIGVYHLNATIQNLNLKNDYNLKIVIDKSFPIKYPKIYSTDETLKGFSHINPNGEFCLGVFIDNYLKLEHNPGLINFFKILVDPFLYSCEFYRRYGAMPFGERPHGVDGIIDFYKEYLGANNDKEFAKLFLFVVKNNKYRGHLPCPCGSGKSTRNCHGNFLKRIFIEKGNKAYAKLLTKDMEELISQCQRQK